MRRHEALIVAIGAHVDRRSRKPTNASIVVQIFIEREVKRLKIRSPKQ